MMFATMHSGFKQGIYQNVQEYWDNIFQGPPSLKVWYNYLYWVENLHLWSYTKLIQTHIILQTIFVNIHLKR